MFAYVEPMGPVTEDAFEQIVDEMLEALGEQGPWDGVLLAQHGRARRDPLPGRGRGDHGGTRFAPLLTGVHQSLHPSSGGRAAAPVSTTSADSAHHPRGHPPPPRPPSRSLTSTEATAPDPLSGEHL